MDRLSNLERGRLQLPPGIGDENLPTTTLHTIMEGFDGRGPPVQPQLANYDQTTTGSSLRNLPMGDTVEVSIEGPRFWAVENSSLPTANPMLQQQEQLEPTAHDADSGVQESPESIVGPVTRSDPAQAEREICSDNGAAFRPVLDVFFRYLNPLHPLINENRFRSQFDDLVFHQDLKMTSLDHPQFVALVYLISAEVDFLNGNCCASTDILGWRRMCTADTIMGDVIWSKMTSLLTIQCLIVKTRCLLCLERFNHAYDTMATAKRICMQTGLHDESKWIQRDVNDFDKAMRRRVYWCLFTLDHVVGVSCDVPPTPWPSRNSVMLPQPVDDRSLFPNRPVPRASPETSFIPYLHSLIEWAQLSLEAWELIHSTNALDVNAEVHYTYLDQKILLQIQRLPPQLQFSRTGDLAANNQRLEAYHLRQRQISYARSNSLRLALRLGALCKLNFDNNLARDVVQICENSVQAVKDSLRYSYNGTDRYFCTVYLSGLVKPISLVLRNEKITQELQLKARECWTQVISLLKKISRDFGLCRNSLQRLSSIINATNSLLPPQQNMNCNDQNTYLSEAANINRPDSSAFHENSLSWLYAGEHPERTNGTNAAESPNPLQSQTLCNDLLMSFPLSHMPTPAPEGDHSLDDGFLNPGQWMSLTW